MTKSTGKRVTIHYLKVNERADEAYLVACTKKEMKQTEEHVSCTLLHTVATDSFTTTAVGMSYTPVITAMSLYCCLRHKLSPDLRIYRTRLPARRLREMDARRSRPRRPEMDARRWRPRRHHRVFRRYCCPRPVLLLSCRCKALPRHLPPYAHQYHSTSSLARSWVYHRHYRPSRKAATKPSSEGWQQQHPCYWRCPAS